MIHAGDLTKQGTHTELRRTLTWIEKADYKVKIVIAGNHDTALDPRFYEQHGMEDHPLDATGSDMLKEFPSITYLNHEAAEIQLLNEDGPQTAFKVFGSPYSPANGHWAFGYTEDEAKELWSAVPQDCDFVVTHTPPKYHCDKSRDHGTAGCEALRQALWRTRPLLAICGHVHEGRGVERVVWNTTSSEFEEISTGHWIDPGAGNKKQSLVDLTSRGGSPLNNHSFLTSQEHPGERKPTINVGSSWDWNFSTSVLAERQDPARVQEGETSSITDTHAATHGEKDIATWVEHDLKAPSDRLETKETCIVNAAVMATSWPYESRHGSKYNKPIIINVDLPIKDR